MSGRYTPYEATAPANSCTHLIPETPEKRLCVSPTFLCFSPGTPKSRVTSNPPTAVVCDSFHRVSCSVQTFAARNPVLISEGVLTDSALHVDARSNRERRLPCDAPERSNPAYRGERRREADTDTRASEQGIEQPTRAWCVSNGPGSSARIVLVAKACPSS